MAYNLKLKDMDTLVSTSLIEMLKYYLDAEQLEKLDHLFKSYERLEIARLKNAYAHGALDNCMNDISDAEGYIKNKFGL